MPDTWIVFSHTGPVYNTYLHIYQATYQPRLSKTRFIVAARWQHVLKSEQLPVCCPGRKDIRFRPPPPLPSHLVLLAARALLFLFLLVPFRFSRQFYRYQSGRDASNACGFVILISFWFHEYIRKYRWVKLKGIMKKKSFQRLPTEDRCTTLKIICTLAHIF